MYFRSFYFFEGLKKYDKFTPYGIAYAVLYGIFYFITYCGNRIGYGIIKSVKALTGKEAQMKNIFKRLLGLFLAFLFTFGTLTALPIESEAAIEVDLLMSFTDVKIGSWYYWSVRRLYSLGIMSGTSTREFSPSANVTRAMFATVLAKVADAVTDKYPDDSDFNDVSTGSWYTRSVNWASDHGYMSGYGEGIFGTKDNITREQLVLVLYEFAVRNQYIVGEIDDSLLDSFVDRDELHDWGNMEKAVCWALGHGIISGMPGDRLAPRENATRAQLAQMINNFLGMWTANPDTVITVSGNDIANYKIVYSDKNASERYAAEEFADYLVKTNGVSLPLCLDRETEPSEYEIIIGHTNRMGELYTVDDEKYGEDGFKIETAGNKLIIAGSSVRGTLYGVYEFLEAYLGWRFYNQGFEICHEMDATHDLADISDEQIPVFEYRDAHMAYYTMEDIAAKRRMNGQFHRQMDADQGSQISYAGGDSYFSHTLNKLTEIGNPHGSSENCCISFNNTAAYDNLIKNVNALLDSQPYADIMGVTQMDANVWCKCSDCMAYAAEQSAAGNPNYRTDQIINIVNAAANSIAEKHPNTRVLTYAYHDTSSLGSVMPADNVIVKYCPINMTVSEPITDPINARYYQELTEWAQVVGENNLYYWDYPIILRNNIAPDPNFYAIYENLRALADIGVDGVFGEGRSYMEVMSKSGRVLDHYKDGEFAELRAYLYAKLLWDPYMPLEEYEALIDEFMQDFYGQGWEHVRCAFDILHDEVEEEGHDFNLWSDAVKSFSSWLDDDEMTELIECFDAAYELADTGEIRNNIARARSQVDSIAIVKYWNDYLDGNLSVFTPEKIVEINERLYRTMVDLYVYPWNFSKSDAHTGATDFTQKPALELLGGYEY